MAQEKPTICFIAQNAYGALAGDGRGHIGGAERQAVTLARWLAAKGYRISFITWDEGQIDGETLEGVVLFKQCRSNAGIRGLRQLYPGMTSLFSAMGRANADIYYQTPAEPITGLTALWCKLKRRRFVYSVVADLDCTPQLANLNPGYERLLYSWGLHHADQIFAQTHHQQQLLQQFFKLGSVMLQLPCAFAGQGEMAEAPPAGPRRVVWVGRIDLVKRLEWLLDIAQQIPELQFEVVAPNLDSALASPATAAYARGLFERAKSLANVVWRGRVSHEDLRQAYQQALCLCCTSVREGFPNTFLEAWSFGTPVVSSFDPDGLIASRQLGTFGTDVAQLVSAIRGLAASPSLRAEQSLNCRDYFAQNHALEAAMPRFERAFLAAWGRESNAQPTLPQKECQIKL